MSSIATALRPIPVPRAETLRREPAAQAFMLLRVAFAVAPILFGLDKFAEVMISDWPKYLAPEFNDLMPGSAQDAMYMVGAVEIAAGLVVALSPRFGGLLVAGWLSGHHREPPARGRLRRHRAARLRPARRRARPLPPGERAYGAELRRWLSSGASPPLELSADLAARVLLGVHVRVGGSGANGADQLGELTWGDALGRRTNHVGRMKGPGDRA